MPLFLCFLHSLAGIDVPPLPAISSAPAPNSVRASSPTNLINSQNASAPSPVIHHTGNHNEIAMCYISIEDFKNWKYPDIKVII